MLSRFVSMLFVAVSAIVSGGCQRGPNKDYPPVEKVTRIEVTAETDDHQLQIIDDQGVVIRFTQFVNTRWDGWGGKSDMAGVPVPQVSATIYSGSQVLGSFGVGPGFFACQREGSFASKECNATEERQFLELVGLPDYELRR